MSSLIAPYVDGELQTTTTSSTSLANSSSSSSNDVVNSDTFLTLLVAEMQNQDPLEPTSNTEWVSQYATFTQVEQIGEMRDSMDVMRANSLVGQEVIMKVTSETTGDVSYVRGVVDYIVMENGEAYLVINEEKYSMDDLDTVASSDYFNMYDKYSEFVSMIDALPSLNSIDKTFKGTIGELYDFYNGLTDNEKSYIEKFASGYLASYNAYIEKMETLGITFETEAEETETTIDDLLDAFNKKMDELMKQITENTSSSSSSGSTGSTTESTGTAAGTTENTDNEETVTDSTESDNATDNVENAGESTATDDNEQTDSSQDSSDEEISLDEQQA